ncbi:MAG: hypothetical protein ACR2PX_07295 [Endozoicomonas sp.]|uniref:hypothetical protein n=1 Tax=Endozoicomonas sp. TaxID=1892382 RepID=UPI003D9ABA7D
MIEVTDREMERAYRDHKKSSMSLKPNSFSGLTCLFYAVECGLKSVLMKRQQQVTTENVESFGHNLNNMLDALRCEKSLRLPNNIALEPLKRPQQQRNSCQSELNQVWRYGVMLRDSKQLIELTSKLEQICSWIKQELRG